MYRKFLYRDLTEPVSGNNIALIFCFLGLRDRLPEKWIVSFLLVTTYLSVLSKSSRVILTHDFATTENAGSLGTRYAFIIRLTLSAFTHLGCRTKLVQKAHGRLLNPMARESKNYKIVQQAIILQNSSIAKDGKDLSFPLL